MTCSIPESHPYENFLKTSLRRRRTFGSCHRAFPSGPGLPWKNRLHSPGTSASSFSTDIFSSITLFASATGVRDSAR